MEELDGDAQAVGDHLLEQVAHLLELREDQRGVAFLDDFLEHLDYALALAAAIIEVAAIGFLGDERGMIADLLEPRQRRQHQRATLDSVGRINLAEHFGGDALVHRRLLGREVAVDLHLHLRRQIDGDVRVIFHATEHERPNQFPQPFGLFLVGELLDRHCELLAEIRRRPEQPGVEHFHDRPQFAQPVLDRRSGQGHAVRHALRQRANRLRRSGVGVLHLLRFVKDQPPP